MPTDYSNKRRPVENEEDPTAAAAAPKLSHRLFASSSSSSGHKRKAASASRAAAAEATTEEQARKKRPAAIEEEGPGIRILEGITRGSIANMVLARLGKLDPNELIGAAPSKPPRVQQFHEEEQDEEDDDGEEDDDDEEEYREDAADESMNQRENGERKEDQKNGGGNQAGPVKESPSSTPPVPKGKLTFFDGVKPQPPSEQQPDQEMKGDYLVHSGPYVGARGTLHRMEDPDHFILQTHDGSVATVHQSQVSKTNSGLPASRSYSRVKLTNEDKKSFVEDIRYYLISGDGHLSREEAATRGYEVANALRIAMSALDPRREVFRRRSSKNPPQHTGATFAARDSRRLS